MKIVGKFRIITAAGLLSFLLMGLQASAGPREIDHCANAEYQLSIRTTGDGFLWALLSNQQSKLLGQYQVHFEDTVNNYTSPGFELRTMSDPNSPLGRKVSFNARLVLTGGEAYGQMTCDAKISEPIPPGEPQCRGMKMPSYSDGAWHCIGGH